MRGFENPWRTWLLVVLCLVLAFTLGAGVVEGKTKKSGGNCEGTKKQRKQKMDERSISDEQLEAMAREHRETVLAERERMKESILRRLERKYEEHQASGAPFVYDILVISGGGAKGAFGAGFLEAWGSVTSESHARPEFDMITGVSTGALIAPFAFIGTEESYAHVARFYANPEPDWVKPRKPFALLPKRPSTLNNCHLQDTLRAGMDRSIVQAVADGAAEDRLLLIGATNLDIGVGRVFDLGLEARRALERDEFDRVHSILLASSAIPGAFPPIEIDGMLHTDGGATSNLFITTFPGPDGPLARFLARHPQGPRPKVRVWILVNQQLWPQSAVTQPKWLSVSGRAIKTLTSSSQIFALALIRYMAFEASTERGVDVELRLVSIPEDAPKKTTKEMFDRDYMRQLEELGREMGADPSSWQTSIPSPDAVQGNWLESD